MTSAAEALAKMPSHDEVAQVVRETLVHRPDLVEKIVSAVYIDQLRHHGQQAAVHDTVRLAVNLWVIGR